MLSHFNYERYVLYQRYPFICLHCIEYYIIVYKTTFLQPVQSVDNKIIYMKQHHTMQGI
jgi:hypothetical protein